MHNTEYKNGYIPYSSIPYLVTLVLQGTTWKIEKEKKLK